MKKLISLIVYMFICVNCYSQGLGYSGDGLGPHKASKDLDMRTFDINVTTINPKPGTDLRLNGDIRINGNVFVGTAPASIELGATLIEKGAIWIEDSLRVGGSAGFRCKNYGLGIGLLASETANFKYVSPSPTGSYSTTTFIFNDSDSPFTSGNVGDFLTIVFSFPIDHINATAEIIEFIDTSNIILDFPNNGDTELTGINLASYVIFEAEIFSVYDGGNVNVIIGDDNGANFRIIAATAIATNTFLVDSVCAINGHATVQINTDVNGCNSVFGILSDFDVSGFDETTDLGIVHNIVINNVGSTGGDVHGIEFSATDPDNSNIETEALAFRPGVDPMRQYLGTPASLGSGINCVLGVCVDSTTALSTTTINAPIFTNDNDTLIIGSKSKFDEINVLLNTIASQTILPEFYYSTGGVRGLTQFSPTDNTIGFRQNGAITFDSDLLTSPVWSTATVTEITNGDLTDSSTYYFIEIIRTRDNLNPDTPIESQIEVTTLGTDFSWSDDGDVEINTVAVVDGITAPSAVPGFIILYGDIADGNLKCVFGDGFIATLGVDQ